MGYFIVLGGVGWRACALKRRVRGEHGERGGASCSWGAMS